MIRPGSPQAAILGLLQRRGPVSVVEIGTTCHMTPDDVRARTVGLESARLVSGRYDMSKPPRRLYSLTVEGVREVERFSATIGQAQPW